MYIFYINIFWLNRKNEILNFKMIAILLNVEDKEEKQRARVAFETQSMGAMFFLLLSGQIPI